MTKYDYLLGDNPNWNYPNEDYLNYVTPLGISQIIINTSNQLFNLNDKRLWDMFCGIGTDSLRFADVTGKVIGTELNHETYKCLKENVQEAGKYNLEIHQGNCLDYLNRVECESEVIYFDPPWGDNYDKPEFSFLAIRLSNHTTVGQLINRLQHSSDLIIKAPYSALTELDNFLDDEDVLSSITFSRQKLCYYMVKAKSNQD